MTRIIIFLSVLAATTLCVLLGVISRPTNYPPLPTIALTPTASIEVTSVKAYCTYVPNPEQANIVIPRSDASDDVDVVQVTTTIESALAPCPPEVTIGTP
jgi:hypothetical protein